VAISTSTDLLDALQNALDQAPETGAVARLAKADDHEQAFQLAQALAPEHLQLLGPEAEALAARITHAGSVFVGENAATAFDDYIAGSNHVLPTGGAARFASALNPAHFRRRFTEVRVSDHAAAELARLAAPVARAEGFELHARSMEARIRENGRE
jgi:histidinol dehydrogenase